VARESEAQGVLFDEKTEGQKSRDTVPLTLTCEIKNMLFKTLITKCISDYMIEYLLLM
jgi:hypothetical protein